MEKSFDYEIIFVGSGISNTFTLLNLIKNSKTHSRNSEKIKIAVIDSCDEFWTGFPYGKRSSINSLLISNLRDFIPEYFKKDFIKWLKLNREEWERKLLIYGGAAAEDWVKLNADKIITSNWEEIFLPRRLFGIYLAKKIEKEIFEAEKHGAYEVHKLKCEVTNIVKEDEIYNVEFIRNEICASFSAKNVVLGIGSPPVQNLNADKEVQENGNIINDIYIPDLDTNILHLEKKLGSVFADKNILVVGSNASALEAIYMLAKNAKIKSSLNKIINISHSGILPELGKKADLNKINLNKLEELKLQNFISADDLWVAINEDINGLQMQGVNKIGAFPKISASVEKILSKMDKKQKKIHHVHGMNLSRMVRRAGVEYVSEVDKLRQQKKMDVVSGAFVKLKRCNSPYQIEVEYIPTGSFLTETFPLKFDAVINCTGFKELDEDSKSPLISNLIKSGLCEVNDTRRGFEVNDDFEASHNMFVIGPLLAGIFTSRLQTWHIENAKRLFDTSVVLAEIISERLQVNEEQLLEYNTYGTYN